MSERLKMQVGLTLNLGDYQSLRADVGIEREGEWVSDKREEEFNSLRDELMEQLERSVKFFEKGTREISGRKGR